MSDLCTLRAEICPPTDTNSPHVGEILGLCQVPSVESDSSILDSTKTFSLHREVGERAILFFQHYFAEPSTPNKPYNCNVFAAAARNWLPIGDTDRNLVGYGGMDILDEDRFPRVAIDETIPGEAYAIFPKEEQTPPIRVLHTFIDIGCGLHIAVRGNWGKLAVAETNAVLNHNKRVLGGKAIQLCHLNAKPAVMGTGHWQSLINKPYPYQFEHIVPPQITSTFNLFESLNEG